MSHLYVAVLAVIVVALLAVALYRTSQVKTKADYLVAGRSLPAFVLVLTLLTSWIGAGSLFAGAENAYRNGSQNLLNVVKIEALELLDLLVVQDLSGQKPKNRL